MFNWTVGYGECFSTFQCTTTSWCLAMMNIQQINDWLTYSKTQAIPVSRLLTLKQHDPFSVQNHAPAIRQTLAERGIRRLSRPIASSSDHLSGSERRDFTVSPGGIAHFRLLVQTVRDCVSDFSAGLKEMYSILSRRKTTPEDKVTGNDVADFHDVLENIDSSLDKTTEPVKDNGSKKPKRSQKNKQNGAVLEMTSEGGCDNEACDGSSTPQRTKLWLGSDRLQHFPDEFPSGINTWECCYAFVAASGATNDM